MKKKIPARNEKQIAFAGMWKQLPPRFVHHHRDGIRQVEASVAGPHRQLEARVLLESREKLFG